jgi:hypothetical protein
MCQGHAEVYPQVIPLFRSQEILNFLLRTLELHIFQNPTHEQPSKPIEYAVPGKNPLDGGFPDPLERFGDLLVPPIPIIILQIDHPVDVVYYPQPSAEDHCEPVPEVLKLGRFPPPFQYFHSLTWEAISSPGHL